MTTLDVPDRCAPRAIRIAKVKFVMLPAAEAAAPMQTGAQSLPATLRAFILRVIGRLEAARP